VAERYEPLPGIVGLPGWIWRKLPPAGRVALAALPVLVVALVLLLGPGIDESKEERARSEAQRLAQLRAKRVEQLRAEQQPRFRRGTPAGASLAQRAALLSAATSAVERDARARVASGSLDGPIRSVQCEPFPRMADGRGAHRDPSRGTGRYSCLAVTREVEATASNEAASIGHPYRVLVNFETGRFAFCKVSGRAGEGALGSQPVVPVPAACGGA
jgi:hypothetical protein